MALAKQVWCSSMHLACRLLGAACCCNSAPGTFSMLVSEHWSAVRVIMEYCTMPWPVILSGWYNLPRLVFTVAVVSCAWLVLGALPQTSAQLVAEAERHPCSQVPDVKGCMVANAHPELKEWCDAHPSPSLFQVRSKCLAMAIVHDERGWVQSTSPQQGMSVS